MPERRSRYRARLSAQNRRSSASFEDEARYVPPRPDADGFPYHAIPGGPRVGRVRRYLFSTAALLVSLPSMLVSAVIVTAPRLLLGWWAAVIIAAIWLLSGVVVFLRQDEAMVAPLVGKYRRPSTAETAVLDAAWANVTRAAGMDGSSYSLWVQDSRKLNAYAAAGHIVGVTWWTLATLNKRQLEAVLAHELGHHLDGRQWARMLARWYSIPFVLIMRVFGGMLLVSFLPICSMRVASPTKLRFSDSNYGRGHRDRGRDRSYERPPAQIPACGITALGSCVGFWRRSALQERDDSRGRATATLW